MCRIFGVQIETEETNTFEVCDDKSYSTTTSMTAEAKSLLQITLLIILKLSELLIV